MLPLGLTELRFIMSITFFVYSHTRLSLKTLTSKLFINTQDQPIRN